MTLTRLHINAFRNIECAQLQPTRSINMLVGENGSGKTSILEAIHYLSVGRSFRTNHTHRVIQHDAKQFTLFGETKNTEQTQNLGIAKTRSGKTEIKIAGETAHKLADLARELPTQVIHPEGFVLATGSPQYRRHFIDWGVFQTQPEFLNVWRQTKRLLTQRNALLRQHATLGQTQYWDDEWIKCAERIAAMRGEYIDHFRPKAQTILKRFLPEYEFELQLFNGWSEGAKLKDILQKSWHSDQQRGFTQIGPHKADLHIKINQIPAQDCLSRGQLKLLVCALRLAQSQHLYETTGRCSILLIDDFASELDQTRREILAKQLSQAPFQVFLTAIHEEQLEEWHIDMSRVFHVKQGQVTPSHQHTVE